MTNSSNAKVIEHWEEETLVMDKCWESNVTFTRFGASLLSTVMFVFILNVVSERLPLSYVQNKHFQIWGLLYYVYSVHTIEADDLKQHLI